MPDWIAHVTAAWILCRLLNLKYKEFNTANTVLVMIGSLLPDLYKFVIPIDLFMPGFNDYFAILHIPAGTLIIAGIISLLFEEKKKAFLLFSLGVFTHYVLDVLLVNINGGMYLFYPLSWEQLKLGLVATDDWHFTLGVLAVGVVVYIITAVINKKK